MNISPKCSQVYMNNIVHEAKTSNKIKKKKVMTGVGQLQICTFCSHLRVRSLENPLLCIRSSSRIRMTKHVFHVKEVGSPSCHETLSFWDANLGLAESDRPQCSCTTWYDCEDLSLSEPRRLNLRQESPHAILVGSAGSVQAHDNKTFA